MMNDTKQVITKEGTIKEIQAGGMFKVELTDGEFAWCVVSGRMRKSRIKVLTGDKVKVEFSPHDLSRGRVTYRFR